MLWEAAPGDPEGTDEEEDGGAPGASALVATTPGPAEGAPPLGGRADGTAVNLGGAGGGGENGAEEGSAEGGEDSKEARAAKRRAADARYYANRGRAVRAAKKAGVDPPPRALSETPSAVRRRLNKERQAAVARGEEVPPQPPRQLSMKPAAVRKRASRARLAAELAANGGKPVARKLSGTPGAVRLRVERALEKGLPEAEVMAAAASLVLAAPRRLQRRNAANGSTSAAAPEGEGAPLEGGQEGTGLAEPEPAPEAVAVSVPAPDPATGAAQ